MSEPKEGSKAIKSNAKIWLKIRQTIQVLAFLVFLYLLLISRPGHPDQGLVQWVFHLDPLVTLASMISTRTFLVEATIGLVISLLLAIVVGRAWCGWLCPMGTLLDWFKFKKKHGNPIPDSWRKGKYGLFLLILFSAILGNLSLLIFDPITILYRSISNGILPVVNQSVLAIERTLYPVSFFRPAISWIESNLRPGLLPTTVQHYQQAIVFFVVFLGIIGLNAFAPRFWCRYLCPLGGLLGLIGKISIFKRQVDPGCRECGLCARNCPTGTIDREKGYASDPGECIVCLECFPGCGESSLKPSIPFSDITWNEYDPDRRALFGTALLSVAGTALVMTEGRQDFPHTHCLRPPGTNSEDLLAACVRCGMCIHACPTNALQPAGLQFGVESLMTPVIVPRVGYCEFTCNTCGEICPVNAIPALALEEKQQQIVGKAFIDQNRCLAWSDKANCIVCEEMCPVPDKAIKIVELEVVDESGQPRIIKAPEVHRDLCIGCGTCENKCPLGGDSAIRVHVENPYALF